jgi:zinc protease
LAGASAVERQALVDPPETSEPVIRVERVAVQKTDQPLAGVVIGFHSNSVIGDPANFPIVVADTMCSGYTYPTGYLFETLRGRGLVYVVHAQNVPGRDASLPGTFMAYAGCDPGKVTEVVDLMLENIARLQGTPAEMQPTWFARSKQLINTTEAMNNETPSEQASTAAVDELLGVGYDYHKSFAERVNGVKLDDVRLAAHQRIWSCVVTICTPEPTRVATKAGLRTYDGFPPVDLTPRGVQHDTGAGK